LEVPSFLGIAIVTQLENWLIFKIELELELGVLLHLKRVHFLKYISTILWRKIKT
jgi:hypothetical protein